ncbi:hypothetical protein CDQ84_08085 [Clostridium thermosuccinogenes]|uniref:MurNAc-LAA domain-containing protein n=1 Tax=Clostridium thermosuccinogenes TaxID=84032 RepID=A0A2K2FL81_9CLOT|nr:N-acetylmuramoyl-L-alanine amidase [Pseudoclostridium thermosuccinogenes]AUS96621.1 hypothetical protein CDO33_09325 [Pseudoclostridium thermosuccinogenes]PNT97536.1 hypothetical protein CDQ85_07930 [Pseudoclostridium thermosuccinogenes]PNT99533.1 hypothetical protein CDQ84_08085 [Pseudoclostridium thermosuccinogenes]
MYSNFSRVMNEKYRIGLIGIFVLLVLLVISAEYATTSAKDSDISSKAYLTDNSAKDASDTTDIKGQQPEEREPDKDVEDKNIGAADKDFNEWLKNTIVAIDPGHGGNDYGTYYEELKEKNITLDVSLKLGELLDKSGVKVIFSREKDVNVELKDRINMANEAGADVFISVHVNGMEDNPEVHGSETLYFNTGKYGDEILDSEKLALLVQEKMVEKLQTSDRGIIERPKLAVLRLAEVPAVIAELAYISNPSDRSKLESQEYRLKAAEALHDAIIEALRLKFENK